MDRQNTNEKKTLKKGRRGWVISAAIVALLGILAGTVVLQNQSSQNQGKSESVTVSDSSSKEKEYSTTDTIKETEKSFPPKVDAKEELSKVFVATKEVGVEDSIAGIAAINSAGSCSVGVGDETLSQAFKRVESTKELTVTLLKEAWDNFVEEKI